MSMCLYSCLVMWHANHVSCASCTVICGLSGSNHTFSHNLINDTILRKKIIEHKLCVLTSSTTFFWNISYSEKNSARHIIYIGLGVKNPLFLSNFNETCIFSTDFQKIIKHQISWKSVQREPSSSMWTDTTKLIVTSRHFVNTPDKLLEIFCHTSRTIQHTSIHDAPTF